MAAIVFRSATEAAAMVRRKEISSRELTESLLARIDAVNPAVNAVVELRREAALREAAAADRALGDGVAGPLHGVPLTIKESFNVAGLHTTWGNPAYKDSVAERDATVVQRLKQAGAVVVGKTNVPVMLGDFGQTANELYGATNNPWDTSRTPGGSSGGAAAALAAGMTFLEYGSDLVGSIRIPASFCGVYGLRPSVGIVPLSGFQPPGPQLPPSEMTYLSAVGPMGRSARDLRTGLTATAGPEAPAANAYSWTLPQPRHPRLADFRIGVVLDHERAPVSSEVTAPLANVVDALSRAGVTIVSGWPEGIDPDQQYESFGFHLQLFFAFRSPVSRLRDCQSSSRRRPGACSSRGLEPLLRRHRRVPLSDQLHSGVSARYQTVRGTHDRDAGRRAAVRQSGILGGALGAARPSRGECADRPCAWRSPGRRANHRAALRGRHSHHLRRTAG